MKVGAHVRHKMTNRTGTVMGVWQREGIQYYAVCMDGSLGCGWACYPFDQWEAA